MSFTPDSILALLALIVMLAPAAQYIYRLIRRRRSRSQSPDIENARTRPQEELHAQLQFTCPRALTLIYCLVIPRDSPRPASTIPALPREEAYRTDGAFSPERTIPLNAGLVRTTSSAETYLI
jgi:hypothetical protein